MKYYYYVNFSDSDVTIDGDRIVVPLNGKSFSKIKVLNAVFKHNADILNPSLKLDTYSGNGFSSDRLGVSVCLFDNLTYVGATDWRYNATQTPVYNISPSLNELRFYMTNGSGNVITPANLQLILELDDE